MLELARLERDVEEPDLFHLGEAVRREVREAEGHGRALDHGSVVGLQAVEPVLGVAGGAGGQVERVHAVEHGVAVLVGRFARRQEVEARLLSGGDVVVYACDSDFEDGAEQLAGRVGGLWLWFFCARVDVAGDKGVFHDCVSQLGWKGGVTEDLGWCSHDC